MDCLSPSSPIEEVVFMKGSQIGGSEAILNVIGYAMDCAPGPILAVSRRASWRCVSAASASPP
jgi:phage terminase large subunit GpA-like protein